MPTLYLVGGVLMKWLAALLVLLLISALALACEGEEEAATARPSPAATAVVTPTLTPSATEIGTPTLSPSPSAVGTAISWSPESGCVNTPPPAMERDWQVSAPRWTITAEGEESGGAYILLPEGVKMEDWVKTEDWVTPISPGRRYGCRFEEGRQWDIAGRIRAGDYSVSITLRNKWGEEGERYEVSATVIDPDGAPTTATGLLESDTPTCFFYPADFAGASSLSEGVYTVIWEAEGGYVRCDGFVVKGRGE